MEKSQMHYLIKPLTSLSDYQKYFEARCAFTKKLFPTYENYYENKYEIDVYDKYSLHIGLFIETHSGLEAAGFARVTQSITDPLYLNTKLTPEVSDFIHKGVSTCFPKTEEHPELALLTKCNKSNKAFNHHIKYLKSKKKRMCEFGRLIIAEELFSNYRPTINLITYVFAVGAFHCVDYSLIQTTLKHASFYQSCFQSQLFNSDLLKEYKAETMIPSSINLSQPVIKTERTRGRLLDIFKRENDIVCVRFKNNEVHTTPNSTIY